LARTAERDAVLKDPFAGIGKPEPRKYVLAGARVVVSETRVDFLQARYHY
jgi:toxin YoeB